MSFVDPEQWRPQDIPDLEDAAWDALREPNSTCVIAGPGAGKTEFLAQRAAYLLQTRLCKSPFKILAISFKKDAAHNLSERVKMRCSERQAARFESLTFDSFTKNLADRFLTAIPEDWKPTKPYDIVFPDKQYVQTFLRDMQIRAPDAWKEEIRRMDPNSFESQIIGSKQLPNQFEEPNSASEFVIYNWWTLHLSMKPRSELTFVMINRLAELLLRTRPQILRSLRLTYPYVFVDEFQDTTYGQYDLLLTAFGTSNTVLTAVGDNKQKIMGWAGALPDAFQEFETNFNARVIPLISNYRSSPSLVRVQQVVATALDTGTATVQARTEQVINGEVAEVWNFPDNITEAEKVAAWIASDIQERGTKPRDYAILVKKTADRFEGALSAALLGNGLNLRNESKQVGKITLQDLLSEEVVNIAIAFMKVVSFPRDPKSWTILSEAITRLNGVDEEDYVSFQKAENKLKVFLEKLRAYMLRARPHEKYAGVIIDQILSFLDPKVLVRTYPEYGSGDHLALVIDSLRIHLRNSAMGAESWSDCIDKFEGRDCIPLMTIHKSKGLEYDTIILIGLDNRTWWPHTPGNQDGVATFFVGLSRAKQRIIFTFCSTRGPKNLISDLYSFLREAGVPEIEYPIAPVLNTGRNHN